MDAENELAALRSALAAAEQRAAAAEEALQRMSAREQVLRQRLDGFVVNIPGILWESYFYQSPDDAIVDYVSEPIESLSGYTVEEWKRPNFWLELIHPDDRPDAIVASQQVIRDGHGAVSYRWITRDGRILWVTSRMTLIRDAAGAPIGMRGVTTDVTEVKQAEAQRVELAMRAEMMRAQEDALLSLSTPMVPIDDDLVAMPLIGTLDLRRLDRVQQALLEGVTRTRARTVILDVTGVPEMDAQTAEALIRTARAVSLLGAEAILTGIRPEVASMLVQFGADLGSITTRSTLKAGIAYAMARRRGPTARGR
jgi:rsbT co-antagonist protein RsbR